MWNTLAVNFHKSGIFVRALLGLPTLRAGPRFRKVKASGNPLRSSGTESPQSGAKKTRGCAETYPANGGTQRTPQFDKEIAEKGHLWMETR